MPWLCKRVRPSARSISPSPRPQSGRSSARLSFCVCRRPLVRAAVALGVSSAVWRWSLRSEEPLVSKPRVREVVIRRHVRQPPRLHRRPMARDRGARRHRGDHRLDQRSRRRHQQRCATCAYRRRPTRPHDVGRDRWERTGPRRRDRRHSPQRPNPDDDRRRVGPQPRALDRQRGPRRRLPHRVITTGIRSRHPARRLRR